MARAAIVGAGLSGLTAGYRLQQAGWDVDVFEATNSPGGRVQTVCSDGYAIDTGASALGSTYHSYNALAKELGVELRLTAPYIGIRRAGTTHLLDMDHMVRSGLTTRLLSMRGKLRVPRLAVTSRSPRRGVDWTMPTCARQLPSTPKAPAHMRPAR